MKLQELAVASPTKQAAKVFESYFGKSITLEQLSRNQARTMLNSVRGLIREHRRSPEFHSSERNPAYLQLIVMEQALGSKIMEVDMIDPGTQSNSGQQPNQPAMAMQISQKRKEIDDQIKMLQNQIRDLQQQRNQPTLGMAESRPTLRQRLKESEIQQAQVVLASQDMVDQVQKMSEQISTMQFKDLPALVDQIKNEVGPDQATTFNGDANAALSGLLQNLQSAKQQLESALGVVTGQAPVVPGDNMSADPGGEMPAELPASGEEEIETDTETDIEVDDEQDSDSLASSLGRGRR
jgi:hypothetical protein